MTISGTGAASDYVFLLDASSVPRLTAPVSVNSFLPS